MTQLNCQNLPSFVVARHSQIFPRRSGHAGFRSRLIWLLGIMLLLGTSHHESIAQIPGDSLELQGNYIWTGVSNNGTLGVGGSTTPGFVFDASGSGDFNTANDYLTPGLPHEGFSISFSGSSVLSNNNDGNTIQIGSATSPLSVSNGYDHSVSWSGTVDGVLTIEHVYGLNDDGRQLDITTTITALTDIEDVEFARWIDPDSGGAMSVNSRGNTTLGLPAGDWVNSVSESNGATLGLYSNSSVTHNTAISDVWSIDPADYLAGSGDTVGDHTIGIGFDLGNLSSGNDVVFEYSYVVSADANDLDIGKVVWKGETNSEWDEATNWDPQEVPTDGSPVNIASTGNANINHNVTGNTYSGWDFNSGSAQVTVQGNDVTLADSASVVNNSSHQQSFEVALISEGDLIINSGSGGLAIHDVQVANNHVLELNSGTASNTVVAGEISGSNITINTTGSGSVSLTGENSFSGNTTITSGTLRLAGGDNRLPTSTTLTNHSGGTLQIDDVSQSLAMISGGGSYVLNSGTLAVQSGSISGTVGGAGTLIHNGSGTFTISGDFSHADSQLIAGAGTMNVSGQIAGQTTVADGAKLSGIGTFSGGLHLQSGSLHTPGNSIGTVNTNDYTVDSGATLEVEIDADGNSDLISDSGTVTINGGTVEVKPDGGVDPSLFEVGDEYTFIHSANPIEGTGFDQVTNVGFDFPVAVMIRELNDYKLRLLGFHFLSYTPNQKAVGEWLDDRAMDGSANSGLTDAMAAVGGLESFADMRQALDQLDGELHPTLSLAGIQVTDMFYLRMSHMMRPTGRSLQTPQVAVSQEQGSWIVRGQSPEGLWGGGVFGYGIGGVTATDGNAHGFNLSTGGTTAIIERQADSFTDIGLFFDYAHSNLALRGLNDASSIDTYRWGGYVTRDSVAGYWNLLGTMGYDAYDTLRAVNFGSGSSQLSETLQADYDGWQGGVCLERGWHLHPTSSLLIQPFVAMQYLYQHANHVTENGGGAISGNLEANDLNSLRTRVGLSASLYHFRQGALSFDTVWTHELLSETTALVDNRLAGATGTNTFLVSGVDLGRDWVNLGPSLEWNLRENTKLWAAYALNFNDNQVFHSGGGGVAVLW
jgi:autotransporter-associated beta strand protein